jgi:hypothetical protein
VKPETILAFATGWLIAVLLMVWIAKVRPSDLQIPAPPAPACAETVTPLHF